MSFKTRVAPRRVRVALVIAAGMSLAGCDSLLEVDESGIIVPGDLDAAGPAAVAALVNGVVGNYHEAADDVIRYTSLLTDEMISSGTFGTRNQVDARRIQVNNSTLTGAMYVPLHQARHMADTTVFVLQGLVQDEAFASVVDDIREGIALGKLYGGYARLWLGEVYCWSILTGMFPESAPVLPDARVRNALTFLREAEAAAAAIGLADVRLAAILGQARAHMWLGEFDLAATLAARVPRDFVYWAEYSHNSPGQYNEMYMFTWGDTEAIDWTVGIGESPTRGNERFEHLDRFVGLNLVRVRPAGYTAGFSSIPVGLQRLYNRQESSVLMASGLEATLILAEAAVRQGQTVTAQDLLNDLRSDFSLRMLLRSRVEPPLAGNELTDLALTGIVQADLKTVADERARELWLTGDRHTTARRFRRETGLGIDLYPPIKAFISGGDDIAFPIVQLELDTNPNLDAGDACPAGQAIGFWR